MREFLVGYALMEFKAKFRKLGGHRDGIFLTYPSAPMGRIHFVPKGDFFQVGYYFLWGVSDRVLCDSYTCSITYII
jgi:hypothetical protein